MRAKHDKDSGFTLIELLVVIIIIGILAAIAVPLLMRQRTKGFDATAKSDLAHLAQAQEIYLSDNTTYSTAANLDVQLVRLSKGVTLKVVNFTGNTGYCLSSKHSQSTTEWFYDSSSGGLQAKGATGCPTTYVTSGGPALVG